MEKVILLSLFIVVFFLVFKVVEMKFVEKEWKPLKIIVRDTVMVFVASCLGGFIFLSLNTTIDDFFHVITETPALDVGGGNTEIFTGNPEF